MEARINLLRHGHALPARGHGDAARTLSPDGEASIRWQSQRLAREGSALDRVFTSPYTRARQTAALMVAAASRSHVTTLSQLMPETDPHDLLAALDALIEPGTYVLLVSHQPLLSYFVKLLTNEDVNISPGTLVETAATQPLAPGGGRLLSVVNPLTPG